MKSLLLLLIILGFISASIDALNLPTQRTYSINWNDSPRYINSNTVFIQQTDMSIYVSYDGGFIFAPLKIANNVVKAVEIIIDPINPSYVLLKGQNTATSVTLYRSVDGGQNFQTSQMTYPLSRITPHPVKTQYLVAHSFAKAYYSTDFGLSWQQAFAGSQLYSQMGIGIVPVWDTQNSTMYALLKSTGGVGTLVSSGDFGKTQTTLLPNAVNMIASNNYIYVGTYDKTNGDLDLFVRSLQNPVTNDAGGFVECEFPFGEDLQPNDYRIIDDNSNAIWLGVVLKQASHWGSMYVSDITGSQYTSVLPHVNLGQVYDFTPFYGVSGVFIANNLTNWQSDPTKPTAVQTLISYDNGGDWSTLTQPADMPCTNGCSLNVHGVSAFADNNRGYGPFYAIPNAPGVAIATGTVNPILSSQPNQKLIKTFLSRDTGQTWTKIFDTGSIYEFGNYGNFIVLADCLQDTNVIYYSIDGGSTFQSVNLTYTYDIINIVTASDNSGMKFILLAQDSNDNGVIITMDFTGVGYPTCTTTDYMNVNITGKTSNGCILGEISTYNMRKPSSPCLVDIAPFSSTSVTCDCTVDDWECDLGFTEVVSNSTTLVCGVDPQYTSPTNQPTDCPAGGNKTVSNGYRLVPGTQCTNGVSYLYAPSIVPCPGSQKEKSKGWIAAVVIIVILVVLGGVGFYIYKNPILMEKVRKLVGYNRGPKYSVVGFKPNSLADDEFGIEDDDAQILNDNDLQDNF
ncbi:PDZ domain-containing protein [Tieghemostelium lacteum]|uniref:PDZ domain-containing protein n=1 Tax=Tieghemostelium lacteum TaxID=361077 RepID=A0A151ZFK5_TIELA|nr:PDZ domain-containing protein [Tieghemostelium lacteum]|eukprot:KYQ92650.1 PDZ domain-containing protein [Tieghemostelium lacteum]